MASELLVILSRSPLAPPGSATGRRGVVELGRFGSRRRATGGPCADPCKFADLARLPGGLLWAPTPQAEPGSPAAATHLDLGTRVRRAVAGRYQFTVCTMLPRDTKQSTMRVHPVGTIRLPRWMSAGAPVNGRARKPLS